MNNDTIRVTASAFAHACRERIKTVNIHTDAGASRAAMLDILADVLDGAVARLPPPPATDWRAKCMIGNQSDAAWWVRLTNDDGLFLWYHHTTGWVGEPYQLKQPCYPTESAARAALAAAPEPGKANPFHADIEREALKPPTKEPSPAPAVAFDAEKAAESLANRLMRENDSLRDWIRRNAAAALRVAEAAGYTRAKTEQTPRKWPEGFNDYHAQNPGHTTGVLRWNQKYGDWDRCQTHQIADGDWWLPQPAAPVAAKEGA